MSTTTPSAAKLTPLEASLLADIEQNEEHLFETLRGSNNLVFGGSRRTVETVSSKARMPARAGSRARSSCESPTATQSSGAYPRARGAG